MIPDVHRDSDALKTRPIGAILQIVDSLADKFWTGEHVSATSKVCERFLRETCIREHLVSELNANIAFQAWRLRLRHVAHFSGIRAQGRSIAFGVKSKGCRFELSLRRKIES